MKESDLYPPVKTWLEAQGYAVKAEIGACDVMAVRGDEPPLIVELKLRFNLDLVLQAMDRFTLSDDVYVAFSHAQTATWRRRRKRVLRLCRRLGVGVLLVRGDDPERLRVTAELDPLPYRPRPDRKRQRRLLKEFAERVGDPNAAGSTRVARITAYRQDALRLVRRLDGEGAQRVAELRAATGIERAAAILQRNVYGWFEREARGIYALSPKGLAAREDYAELLADLPERDPAMPTDAADRDAPGET